MSEKLVGIEELRAAVRLFDQCNESFNWSEHDPFTAEQLLNIYRAHKACEWDLYPDQWLPSQARDAANDGIVPNFREATKEEHATRDDLCAGLVPL
jgi:hypothetical protein